VVWNGAPTADVFGVFQLRKFLANDHTFLLSWRETHF